VVIDTTALTTGRKQHFGLIDHETYFSDLGAIISGLAGLVSPLGDLLL
jgi:hypothetical protein